MKKLIIYLILLLAALEIDAQTLIATSNSFEATANHNQRKIVRDSVDNVYVVFVDSTEQGKTIRGLWLNKQTNDWSSIIEIVNGTNPSLSINKFGKFNLLFESNDSLKAIMHTGSIDFTNWTTTQRISEPGFYCRLPICDSDSKGKLNAFWIKNLDSLQQSLIYARIVDDTINVIKTITTKSIIKDIAIANHLQNFKDDLMFSLQFNDDSLQFLGLKNNFELGILFETRGTQPCISYNSMAPYDSSSYLGNPIRLLFINELKQLVEVECRDYYSKDYLPTRIIESGTIDFICIDDLAPPLGYSYLFMKNGNLYHGFSYGAEWDWSTILNTISTNPFNPSLAYKNFNYFSVDYIWMQKKSNGYEIYYKRDEKYVYVGINDYESGKGFRITGYPNPFNDKLNIEINVNNAINRPILEIYDSNSRKLKILNPTNQSENKYYYCWDINEILPSGLYFIKCSVGQKTTVKKVIHIK